MHEHDVLQKLSCYIDVPCIVQWVLLWYSAPSMGFPVVFCSYENVDLVIANTGNYGRVLMKAWSRPSKFRSKTFPPRRCFLTAQGVVSKINQRIGWEQIRPDNVIKGWKIGGQPEPLDEDDDLMKLGPERECETLEGSGQEDEDDEEWTNFGSA